MCGPPTRRRTFYPRIKRRDGLGAYVDRLETDWLASPEAQAAGGGTPTARAEETHRVARSVWEQLPERRVVDDPHYAKVLPSLDRQVGLGGIRLARWLNEAYAAPCLGR